MVEQLITRLILVTFFFTSLGPLPNASAQSMIGLPAPGAMVDFSPKFNHATLKGIIIYPRNPFKFDFILDEGDVDLNQGQLKAQSQKIASYFFASLTTPEKEIWVNLSPYERNRIVPTAFGHTLMGQNLLAQDYMLKQIMATALYPERQLGREFWQKIYTQALIKFGTTNVPINTFNKVWIVPDKAVVYENARMNAVFVVKSSLKVMLENDYLSATKHKFGSNAVSPVMSSVADTMSAAVIKELVIPALEKEVNTGKNFAPLRQVYNALILAKWYKDNLKNSLLAKGYVNRNKIKGVDSSNKLIVSEIYRQYLKAYKKGVFNFIQEDFDQSTQSTIPRKYFSGGIVGDVHYSMAMIAPRLLSRRLFIAEVSVGTAVAQNVRNAIGAPGAPAPLNQGEEEALINDIKNAHKNPKAAAVALRRMSYRYNPKAVQFAVNILKLRADPIALDKALKDLPSNSSGPGLNFPGGPAVPVAVTNLGVIELALSVGETIRQRANFGNSTLRYEAALYLESVAGHVGVSSNWNKLFQTGAWEAISTQLETDVTVKAARLVAMAAFIKAGKESRMNITGKIVGRKLNIGNDNIEHLDMVFKELQSDDEIVRLSALMVFDSIKTGDLDNQYQGMIGRSLQEQSKDEKGPADIVFFEKMTDVANKHEMTTVLPSIMKGMLNYFNNRPSLKTVEAKRFPQELKKWHQHMENFIQMSIKLSDVNGDGQLSNQKLFDNFNVLTESFTAPGSMDLYLGLLFTLVRSHRLSLPQFISLLNGVRKNNSLDPVDISENKISFELRGPMARLEEINDRKNVVQNVNDLVALGGPMYFPDLLEVFQRTDDVPTVQAILDNLDTILSMGIYPHDNNPWVDAIKEKAKNDNIAIRDAVKKYEVNHKFGMGVLADLRGGDRLTVLRAFELLLASPFISEDYVSDTVRFVFSENNPFLDDIELGQTQTFNRVLALAARVIVASGMNDTKVDHLIDLNTPPTATGTLTARQLRRAIEAVRNKRDPEAALYLAVDQEWEYAERRFIEYLQGANIAPEKVAAVLDVANQMHKRPSDPGAGYTIAETIMTKYVANSMYRKPGKMLQMAQVFAVLKNKDWGFELMGGLLDPGASVRYPDVDKTVLDLFRQKAEIKQQKEAADTFVELYLYWFLKEKGDNQSSGPLLSQIGSKVSAFGPNVLTQAVNRRLPSVDDADARAALQGLLYGRVDLPKEVIAQSIPAATGSVSAPRAISSSAGLPYYQAVSILTDANSSDDQVMKAITSLQGMSFPSTVFRDLIPVLRNPENYSWYGDPEHKRQFIQVIARAVKQLGSTIRGGDTLALIKKAFLDAFDQADGYDTQLAVLNTFISTSDVVAADLFWEGLNRLEKKYNVNGDPQRNIPAFSGDPQKRAHFFDALKIMRDIIADLEADDLKKFQTITARMQRSLKEKSSNNRFEMGIEYVFLSSIKPNLADPNLLGITEQPDDHFMKGIEKPAIYNTIDDTGKQIAQAYGNLAGRLNNLIPRITSYQPKDKDPLAILESLFNPLNPMAQMSAIHSLKGITLLFQNRIPHTSRDVFIDLLYHGNQYGESGDNLQMMMDVENDAEKNPEHYSPEELILLKGQLFKRGTYGRNLVFQDLQNEKLYTDHPEAVFEHVWQCQLRARADMVDPLLHLLFARNLVGYNLIHTKLTVKSMGVKVEEAFQDMNKRDKGVKEALRRLHDNLSDAPKNWLYAGPILQHIIDRMPDRAMANGGIDLANVNLQSQGTGNVKTVFNDPAQLAILMRSDGLIPVIGNVRPLTQTAINQLVGSI